MIATVQTRRSQFPCIVYRTSKTSFISVESQTYCGEMVPAGDGVTQLPDNAKCCEDCTKALDKAKAVYADAVSS